MPRPVPASDISDAQRTAAKFVGAAYIVAIPLALFSNLYVPAQLVVAADAAATAQNILAHEHLFRLGIASDLLVFLVDIVLVTALYTVLKPVHRELALFATLVRLVETSLFVVITVNGLDALRFLGNAVYLKAFTPDQLHALARLSISAHNTAYGAGLVFAGVGSAVFCWLWLRSKFVPAWLAGLGVAASTILALCTGTFVVFPDLSKTITVAVYGGPIFVFELTMGLWLLTRGLHRPPLPAASAG